MEIKFYVAFTIDPTHWLISTGLHANGIQLPIHIPGDYTTKSPAELWDQVPEAGKWQIVLFVGFLEVYSEHSFILEKEGQKHYCKGGKPGYFPTFDTMVHPCPLNLYDPFGWLGANMSEEVKAKRRNIEINNGRLAMFGIMGFLANAHIPGAVPTAAPAVAQYAGNVMKPFADFATGA